MKPQAKPASASKIDLSWAVESQNVWVMLPEDDPSGEACTKGVIVKLVDEETAQVQVEGSQDAKPIKGDKIYPLNDYKDFPRGYDDMVDIENLSEAELLNNLGIRFKLNMIYTYVGPTLIVLNPYKMIDKELIPAILAKFQNSLLSGRFEQKEHQPHVFAIAATTMKNMFENKKNQAIVISGESGAGKTENTKSAMKFLTSLGKSEEHSGSQKEESIEDKILACNPILEAFGNAKTVRNDNSSRFGKYVALLVEKDTRKIVGATITNYLLEKSRVINQNSEERNYHIFYAFLRGASEETLKNYFLTKNLDDWAFLKNAFKGEVKTVPDAELYKEVTDSFNTMKFTDEEQKAVWTYTAAALMVGNIDFDEAEFSDSNPCQLKNEQYLINAAKILNVDFEKFSKSLRFKTRVVGGSTINSTIKRDECLIFRDSLAKDLFNKLFNWLVRRLNFTVMPPEFTKGGLNMSALMAKYYHIGLLDIFGFEIFNFNSIEQFCINFSNEKLQQLYISYVFKGEEKEFINEGLKDFLCELTFKDNQSLIDMLDSVKLPGIFQMIDESCSVTATDQNLYDKIIKQFKKPEFPLTTQKIARDTFIVKHTAKEVEYNINGFRAKNKDEISKTIEESICSSSTPEIVKVWKCLCLDEVESEEAKNAKPNPKDKFLGYKFRAQMKELMDELNSCECHFIRCLKPNEKKQADFFLPQLVLQQIKYMGILDTIKVRKDSFPVRTPYRSFYEKYQVLAPQDSRMSIDKHIELGSDFKAMSEGICKRTVPGMVNSKMILYGNTKMFLRVEASKEIEKLRREIENKRIKAAKMFQNAHYRYKALNLFRGMRTGVKTLQQLFEIKRENLKFVRIRQKTKKIQRWLRAILENRRMEKFKGIVFKIQKWWKMKFFRTRYIKMKAAVIFINRVLRGARVRLQNRRVRYCRTIAEDIVSKANNIIVEKIRTRAAHTVQKFAKGYICRSMFQHQVEMIRKAKRDFVRNKMAKLIQKNVTGFLARNTYRKIRKSTMTIQGYMRMKWLSSLFQKLKGVSVIIQKAVRRWLITRKIKTERMTNYMVNEGAHYKAHHIVEQANFFGLTNVSKAPKTNDPLQFSTLNTQECVVYGNESYENNSVIPSELSPTFELTKMYSSGANQNNYASSFNDMLSQLSSQKVHPNTIKEVDHYSSKKIHIFSKVLDVDMLTDSSLLYDPMWSAQVLQIQNESMSTDADLQLIEVGQAHTTLASNAGKVFSFGWNDCFQLGKLTKTNSHISPCSQISFPTDNFRPKSVVSGDDHNLLLDYNGNLHVWGDNSQGQLGLGHSRELSRITVLEFLENDSIAEIKAKGNNSLVVTQAGKAFYWPLELHSGEKIYTPTELHMPPKIQVSTAACGYNFAMLVSKTGLLFSFGRDNQAGQLGHGDTMPRDSPTLVETLKNEGELVVAVSCGYKHVICKSKQGRAYSWGWGQRGQLGHGELENELRPRLLNLSQSTTQVKVAQVQAGFSHSVIAMSNRKLYWCGNNASLENQAVPVEVNLQKKIPDYHKEFTPIKILCAWSKTMNVTYTTLADTRTTDLNLTHKQKVLSTLTSKIEDQRSFHHVDIPFIDSISKHFHSKIMKDRSIPEVRTNKNFSGKKNNNPEENHQAPNGLVTSGMPRFCHALSKIRLSPKREGENPKAGDDDQRSPKRAVNSNPIFNSPPSRLEMRRNMSKKLEESGSGKKSSGNSAKKGENQAEVDFKALNEKLVNIKKKMEQIKALPMEKWSEIDIEFLKMATEPKMLELIQKAQV